MTLHAQQRPHHADRINARKKRKTPSSSKQPNLLFPHPTTFAKAPNPHVLNVQRPNAFALPNAQRRVDKTPKPGQNPYRSAILPNPSLRHPTYSTFSHQNNSNHLVNNNQSSRPASPPSKSMLVRSVQDCRTAVEALSHHSHIALDCEGVALSRTGRLCLLQAASPDAVYIFDLIHHDPSLNADNNPLNSSIHGHLNSPPTSDAIRDKPFNSQHTRAQLIYARQLFDQGGLRSLLENNKIYKVMHDCRHDSDALYHQFSIRLGPVIDTQVVFFILRRSMGMEDGLPVSLKTLLRKFSLMSEDELNVKHAVKDRMKGDNDFWLQRPLSDTALWYARLDVHHLLPLTSILAKLIQSSSDQGWKDVERESQLYLSVFRDDFDGPRKAQAEYEMRAKIASRERTAVRLSKKASAHRNNDLLQSFSFDRSQVVDAVNE